VVLCFFSDFFALLLALAGAALAVGSGAAAFLGRPFFISRIISKVSGGQIASLVKGFKPAVSIRFLTASADIFSSVTSSETVHPFTFMTPIIGVYTWLMKYIEDLDTLLYKCKVNFGGKCKKSIELFDISIGINIELCDTL
jgi:hypothetical protein